LLLCGIKDDRLGLDKLLAPVESRTPLYFLPYFVSKAGRTHWLCNMIASRRYLGHQNVGHRARCIDHWHRPVRAFRTRVGPPAEQCLRPSLDRGHR
jgi:hypothetical protein